MFKLNVEIALETARSIAGENLGQGPLFNMKDWFDAEPCGYDTKEDFFCSTTACIFGHINFVGDKTGLYPFGLNNTQMDDGGNGYFINGARMLGDAINPNYAGTLLDHTPDKSYAMGVLFAMALGHEETESSIALRSILHRLDNRPADFTDEEFAHIFAIEFWKLYTSTHSKFWSGDDAFSTEGFYDTALKFIKEKHYREGLRELICVIDSYNVDIMGLQNVAYSTDREAGLKLFLTGLWASANPEDVHALFAQLKREELLPTRLKNAYFEPVPAETDSFEGDSLPEGEVTVEEAKEVA